MFREKLTREQFWRFMTTPPCLVVFEAYGRASDSAREMAKFGRNAKLIAPQYVRPFVKRQKNDAADAEIYEGEGIPPPQKRFPQ